MYFFERFGAYILSFIVALIFSLAGGYILGYHFENLFMLSGIVICVVGISMNSQNSYRDFGGKTGNSYIEYDTFVEMRSEKQRKGNYDYTDRSHGFNVGMKLVFSGIFILVLGVGLSYLLPYLR
ncbi:hypothetical protein [Haloplasma contractile]|uniref:DUF3899 domain-containing protein n=1 Tax=Haloplasma contractile SSD-17B TaxID=1033810 RepID=U2EEL7_9MOLU|nr:hypothetical protein [Haloplasma contractile]ERJ13141.1 hypothetical protein HLPCO_000760 [Haloplasma contractile SSD-17B]